MAQGESRGRVGWVGCMQGGVLPCVDEEAVEAAERGEEECRWKQGEAELRLASYRRDEGGGSEEDAYGDLLGQAVCAACGVPTHIPADDELVPDGMATGGAGG